MSDGFESLYRAKHAAIFRQCLHLLDNREDAAEATQEVFSRLLRARTDIDNPAAWLHRVAHNHCMNRLRNRREAGAAPDCNEPGCDPEQQALARLALSSAFASLTPKERQALARAALHDRSIGTVARELGMTYMAAAKLLSRARRRAAAVAGALVGLGAGVLARRPPRPAGMGGGIIASAGQNAVVAVAAVLVAGTAAMHFSSSDGGSATAPRAVPIVVLDNTPAPSSMPQLANVVGTPNAAPSAAAPAGRAASAPTASASRPPATAGPATAAPTPAPVVVGAGPYRCNPNASAPLDTSCLPH